MNFATRNVGKFRVEQGGQRTQNTAFRLTAQSEQNEVVARKDGVHYLGHNRVFVNDNPRKYRLARAQPEDQVVAQFVFDAARKHAFFTKLRMTTKLGKGLRKSTQGWGTSRVPTVRPHVQSIVGILRQFTSSPRRHGEHGEEQKSISNHSRRGVLSDPDEMSGRAQSLARSLALAPVCSASATLGSTERRCKSRCGKGISIPASFRDCIIANATSLVISKPLFSCMTQKCSSKSRVKSPNPLKYAIGSGLVSTSSCFPAAPRRISSTSLGSEP